MRETLRPRVRMERRKHASAASKAAALLGVCCSLVIIGCSHPVEPSARVTAITRGHVQVAFSASPGCVVEQLSHEYPVDDTGEVLVDLDVSDYSDVAIPESDLRAGITTLDFTAVCSRYVVDTERTPLHVELPLGTTIIKRLPESGAAFVGSTSLAGSAVATGLGSQMFNFGADAAGHALMPIAFAGADEITVAGVPASLDPVSHTAIVPVDLTRTVLAGAAPLGEFALPVASAAEPGASTTLRLALTEPQVTAILDRWIDAGAPASDLPSPPGGGVLWRRAPEVNRGSYATLAGSTRLGSRYLATESTQRRRLRGCGYIVYWGLEREIVLRDVTTGQEVARRSFRPPRAPRCPEVTFNNQPDRVFYATNTQVGDWLEAQVEHLGD